MQKTISFPLIFFCLIALCVAGLQPTKAQFANGKTIITINFDGSVTPPSASIQQLGNLYALTNDLQQPIWVDRSNAILDGNGHSVLAGITLSESNITVKDFIIKGGAQFGEIGRGVFAGIYLNGALKSEIINNTIIEVFDFLSVFEYDQIVVGIDVSGGNSNIISGNNLVNNWQGMTFSDTTQNLIVENSISSNSTDQGGNSEPGGMYFDSSSNNTIYHNDFEINIGGEAKDSYYNSVNVWDDGYPLGGNFWSDYQKKYPHATEIDKSEIGDTPYVIDELDAQLANNTDYYPLLKPFNSTFFELQITSPKISIDSPSNQTYNQSSVPLIFSVDLFSSNKTLSWAGYSLDDQQNVTIIGNASVANITSGLHMLAVYCNDTFGNMGASTVNFTIVKVEPSQVATVAAVSITILVVVAASLIVYFKRRKS